MIKYLPKPEVTLVLEWDTNDGDYIREITYMTLKEWNSIEAVMFAISDAPRGYGEGDVAQKNIYDWVAIELHTTKDDIVAVAWQYLPHADWGWHTVSNVEVIL